MHPLLSKSIRSDNAKLENEKVKLERLILEKDSELLKLR
jgi:hypothetical protein